MTGQAGHLKPDTVEGVEIEIPEFNVSYKPQKISPKFPGSVRQLLHKKIRDSYTHPQFISDVVKPLQIEQLMDQEVMNLSGGELQRVALCLCLGQVSPCIWSSELLLSILGLAGQHSCSCVTIASVLITVSCTRYNLHMQMKSIFLKTNSGESFKSKSRALDRAQNAFEKMSFLLHVVWERLGVRR